VREMGQSAWLSTSFLTLQGWEARVNAMETGIGCNDRISWSNKYSIWPASSREFGEAPRDSTPSRRMLKMASLLTRPTPARQDAPLRGQGRRSTDPSRFTFYILRFTVPARHLGSASQSELAPHRQDLG